MGKSSNPGGSADTKAGSKMKMRAQKNGFTLIEILVVIAIIAILAAILVPAAGHAMRSAKKKRAMAEMNSIKVAALQFFDDHRYMPWPATILQGREVWVGEDKWTPDDGDQLPVMLLLTGDNAKKKVYLQIPEKSRPDDKSMLFLDPWGQPYHIGMDRNSDGAVTADAATGGDVVTERVLVYSEGEPDDPVILKTFD